MHLDSKPKVMRSRTASLIVGTVVLALWRMRKRVAVVLSIPGILALAGFLIYSQLPPSEAGRKAVEQLKRVDTFSLGPVGYAGTIPQGEDAFFDILSSRHSSALFTELFEKGTPEARVYALCGLHLSDGDFEGYATRFVRENATVSTLSGCIGGNCTPVEAVSLIRKGAVKRYLQFRQGVGQARSRA